MSIRLMTKVWDGDFDLTHAELLVLLCLADHADDEGVCWPAIPRIAKRTRVSERHCKRVVDDLATKRILKVEVGGGRGHSTRYRITLPDSIKGDMVSQRVTSDAGKGDTVSPDPLEPSIESSSIVNDVDEQSPQAGQAILPLQQIEQEQEASSLQSPNATVENKATMRNEPSLRKKGAVLSESWRDLLMPVMVGHGDFALVSKQQWGNMRACAKQLQSAGASEDDVLGWWESVWCKGWPGLQDGKVKPAGMSQVLQGVGIWRASKPEPAQEAVASDEFQVIEEDME